MSNNFESNFTRQLMEKVIPRVEANRIMSKNVDTQLFQGKFSPRTGESIDVQRPTDYKTTRTPTGDITGSKESIVRGKATATVQDYITVAVDYDEADEALKMGDNKDSFWDDIAQRIVIDLETDFANFMMKNSGLSYGNPDNPVDSWSDIAGAGALMRATGVPGGDWFYALNPFSQVSLANEQRSLGVNPDVAEANKKATVMENFAGMTVKEATTLSSFITGAGADRAGVISANPIVTYFNAKDTMTQAIPVSGFQASLEVKAGEVIEITGRNRLNLATKNTVIDETGAAVLWRATVTQDVTLDGAGAGTLVVTGPAIFEAAGAYNTVDSAPIATDIVTILGAGNGKIHQPNLFWRRDAFTIAYIDIKKLHSTDTVAQTTDGLSMRCSKYSDGDANQQTVRFDLRPAYGTMNPLYAGLGFGK